MRPFSFVQAIAAACILTFAAGCTPRVADPTSASPVEITVSAAASLTESFTEIGRQYEDANPQVRVIFNFAGSQQLARQIVEGASVDVFASANQLQMGIVLADTGLPESAASMFAGNQLVVIYPIDNPGEISNLVDLARPGLKLVLVGDEAPSGQYTLEFLDRADQNGNFGAGYKDAVLANVVSFENNVRSVLTKVSLGEADGGIVYVTDAASVTGEVGMMQIPSALNINAGYWILALPDAAQAETANDFVAFVLSAKGQQVLEKYGFFPVR